MWSSLTRFSVFFLALTSLFLNSSVSGLEAKTVTELASDTQVLSGTISGSVLSSSGARLEGTFITVTNENAGKSYQVVSGKMGMFRITGLDQGKYKIEADLKGFRSIPVPQFNLEAGADQVVNISMEQAFSIEENVTVIGRAPASSLEYAEIRESPARDLGEALSKRAGVWQVRKGGIANDVNIRGIQARNLNVLIDGQRVYGACPNHMDPSAFHVDFAEVDRVDVAKGPFDVKNEGGFGGSVNIVTRRPRDNWNIQGNMSAGSFGFLNPSAAVSYGGDRFSALGGFSYRISNPFTDGSGKKFTEKTNYRSDAVDNKAFDIGTFWGKVAVSPSSTNQLQFSFAHQEANNVLYPFLKMDADYDDTNRFGLRWESERLSDTVTGFLVQAYYSQVDHWMTDRFRTSAMGSRGYSMGTMANTRTIGGKIETRLWRDWTFGFEAYQRFWGVYTEMAGMNYVRQNSLPDVDITSFGFYGEYMKPISESLTFTAGGRLDRIRSKADPTKANTNLYKAFHDTRVTSATDVNLAGFGRLNYQVTSGIILSTGAGTAMEVPESTERFFGLKRKSSAWVGNPLLYPSRNTGIDGSFNLEKRGIFFSTDLFFNWINDYVTLYDQPILSDIPGIMNQWARTYANVDAWIRGLEFNVAIPLKHRLFLSGDLSYVRGTKDTRPDIGLESTNLSEIPPLRSRIDLRFDQGQFFVAAEGVFSASQNNIDEDLQEEITRSYAIMNISGGFRSGIINLTVGIGNLFNRLFSEHLSYQRDPFRSGVRVNEPGRNLFLNLGIDF